MRHILLCERILGVDLMPTAYLYNRVTYGFARDGRAVELALDITTGKCQRLHNETPLIESLEEVFVKLNDVVITDGLDYYLVIFRFSHDIFPFFRPLYFLSQ